MKHTKGNWKKDGELDDIQIYVDTSNGKYVDTYKRIAIVRGSDSSPPNYEEAEANAKRICHCVNNFDEVSKALDLAWDLIKRKYTNVRDIEKTNSGKVITEAISKAKG